VRLYRDRLYTADGSVPVDSEGRIRMDDWEMREDVQKAVVERMNIVTTENVFKETDVAGFKHDFMEAHGFDVEGIDYNADVEIG
jgi:enoyl-[acyl-carrier protein] reductase/trans-2-enoyl-CoA reductase (NAD+)